MATGEATIQSLKSHYESGKSDLAKEFFAPCLEHCCSYKRAVGFFSSSALISWAQILPRILENDGIQIQLLISPHLSEVDQMTLQQVATPAGRNKMLQEWADRIVLEAVKFSKNPSDVDARMRVFAWMVARGRLELRFAYPEHVDIPGLFHEKIGVFVFPWRISVAFTGSPNESVSGHSRNYETIDVFRDWIPEDRERVQIKITQFDDAWNGTAHGLRVLQLSENALNQIQLLAPEDCPMSSNSDEITADDAPVETLAPRPYQVEAIDAWIRHGKRGILDMATGTGKTKTAFFAMNRLRPEYRQLLVVVIAPYKHLVEQWAKDCEVFGLRYQICNSDFPGWEHSASNLRLAFASRTLSATALLTTYATFSSQRFQEMLQRFSQPKLLIADEVHHLGAASCRFSLTSFDARLGLSATPVRTYDPDGTAWLLKNVGPIVYRFSMKQAIPHYLCPYDYHLHVVRLTTAEQEEYQEVMTKISLACARGASLQEEDPDTNQSLGALLRRRNEIIGSAENKLQSLNSILRGQIGEHGVDSLKYSLFYASSRLFDRMMLALSNVHDLRVSKFTFEESREERADILENFSEGRIHAILAKKCLDEGMDVPATRTAFILASSANPMEFIQRRGRVLRKYRGKEFATVHDFFVLPAENSQANEYDRRLVERELKRVIEFADTSRNPVPCKQTVIPIQQQYNLLHL